MNYYLKRNDSIQTEKVMLLEALENYTLFHLNDGRKIISSLTLKRHQEKLEIEFFVRVNRSTIINKNFVKKILLKDRTNFIRLKNGKEIKVSRRRQDTLSQLAS
ncbi:LytTR family DNA-binding domain-containing protein [uncultured Arcticibacterium sp.]|uniref:LytR/AlgR family response regulator transcription factor n=1 Tax=uncultured Arcticibacterium sp. TaxID=2173042 RepID=UPI0030F855D7